MATIKEISRKAGVSPTTVANVLYGRTAKVSAETREKVQAIIEEENYTPNMGAMMLLKNNSRIIGVIMFTEPRKNETVLEDPFSSAILGAMEREIRESGYYMMLYTTSDEAEVVRLSKAWKMDGLILVWVPGNICRIINSSIDVPCVYIDCFFEDDEHTYHNIGLEDRMGGYEVTETCCFFPATPFSLVEIPNGLPDARMRLQSKAWCLQTMPTGHCPTTARSGRKSILR